MEVKGGNSSNRHIAYCDVIAAEGSCWDSLLRLFLRQRYLRMYRGPVPIAGYRPTQHTLGGSYSRIRRMRRWVSLTATCCLLACTGVGQVQETINSTPRAPVGDFTVSSPAEELSEGYLKWAVNHPRSVEAEARIRILMPTLDLYSPSGVSLYHGEDSLANAAFIRTLPKGIGNAKPATSRPSLKEAIEMFSELKAKEDALLADKSYTIFAITYPDWDRCMDQNAAVAELRGSKGRANIRVIEVRLHK
jgi:hypothetical protein